MVSRFKFYFLRLCTAGFIFGLIQTAAFARILTSDEVSQADTQALIAETDNFNAIGMGIALSIALCEGIEDCIPSVDHEELKQLLQALDNRIEHLTTIVNNENIEETDLNEILTAYVDQRENYLRYRDDLGKIVPLETEDIFAEEDEFSVEEFVVEEVKVKEKEKEKSVLIDAEIDFSIFEDADIEFEDEELSDDEFDPEEDL